MIGLVRAAVVCATLALGLVGGAGGGQGLQTRRSRRFGDQAGSPDQERGGAGRQIHRDAADRRRRRLQALDFRTGLQILGQIAATTPEDSANWLRLAKTIFQIRSASSSEQTFLLERASTAAYIAYQRAGNPAEEADALAVLGRAMSDRKLWRPALDACGCRSTCARSPRCAASTRRCATSTASGCWITPSIPTAPRRGPASSSPRTSPSGSILRRSWRWPAPTSRRCRPKASSSASTA
jgi:hypothetical protein